MQETARTGGSVYLRGYEEQYHHSLKLTAAPQAGAGHVAWRSRSPQALERRVAAIEAAGLGRGWTDGDARPRPRLPLRDPRGSPDGDLLGGRVRRHAGRRGTALRNRPQRRPASGVPVRRIDHLNLMVADTAACRDFMVGRARLQRARAGDGRRGTVVASWLSVTNLSHDIALVPEPTPARGRFHHVCFHYTSLQHLFDLAELAREAGIRIETGPGRHGIGGAAFLYLIEPGGNRIELMGDPGYMIFDPAWRTVVWDASEIGTAVAWAGSPVPDSFWVYGTPPAEVAPSEAAA